MTITTLSRSETNAFSNFSCAFSNGQAAFSSFLEHPLDAVEDLVEQAHKKSKSYSAETRKVLVSELTRQLHDKLSEKQAHNLELLSNEKTFTVTTGHQLTLFAGPLYFVYKALHVVQLANQFNALNSEYKVVPIFWLASEDHDFEEVKSTSLFNQTLTWGTEQAGAVGRFQLEGWDEIQTEFRTLFDKFPDAAIHSIFRDGVVYENYGQFFQQFVTTLFQDFGLLVLQPDTLELKRLFASVIERELYESPSLQQVTNTNQQLELAGWKPQANARAINLFLLDEQGRHRIEPTTNGFTVNGAIYGSEEMKTLIKESPNKFSPNVILRPVYQETILPNLVYVGGGAEMNYWLQLKGVFQVHKTQFPLLQQRVSLHLVDAGMKKRMNKLEWDATRFFEPKEQLKKDYLKEQDKGELDFSEISEVFQNLRLQLIEKAKSIDVSLESYAEAETIRMNKQLESYEQKLLKQVKQQHDQALKNIEFVSDKYFINNSLQERELHWLNFATDGNYAKLFKELFSAIDPFKQELILLELGSNE